MLKEGMVATIYTRWRGYQACILCPARSVVWKAKSVATLRYHTLAHQVTTLPETPVFSPALPTPTLLSDFSACWCWIPIRLPQHYVEYEYVVNVSCKLCCSEKYLRGFKEAHQEMIITICNFPFWRRQDSPRSLWGVLGSFEEIILIRTERDIMGVGRNITWEVRKGAGGLVRSCMKIASQHFMGRRHAPHPSYSTRVFVLVNI